MAKKIREQDRVELALTERQRTLVFEDTLADPDLTAELRSARPRGAKLVAMMTLNDLDHLSGFVAAAANHCEDTKLAGELDRLFDRILAVMNRYDDGNWQAPE